MSEPSEYRYDIFISYSHQDAAFVRNTLLPSLETAGLRVSIDYRDFLIGSPSLHNMEQAVEQSRYTLVVLTPAWVASEWTEFESLLVGIKDPAGRRRKLLPIMLEQCKPPARIAMLTYADFRDSQRRPGELSRLVQQIRDAISDDDTSAQDIAATLSGLSTPHTPTPIPPARTPSRTNELRIKMLEQRLASLTEEYSAAHTQVDQTMSAVDRLRIQRQLADLEQQMTQVEDELRSLE